MRSLESATTFRSVFDFEKASQPKRQTELCVRETRWTMENLAKLHADLQSESICLSLGDTTNTCTQPQTLAKYKISEPRRSYVYFNNSISAPQSSFFTILKRSSRCGVLISTIIISSARRGVISQQNLFDNGAAAYYTFE